MIGMNRLRGVWKPAVTASLALALAACGPEYPNTTFAPLSELGENVDKIWDVLLLWGMIVFVLVEVALIYIVIRYRHRDNAPKPAQIHGHTTLEIVWTAIPAAILLFIAVPTVRTIFVTQADAPAGALQVSVKGHQWWWEFEYPELGVKTANELYLPAGRTVALSIETQNVLHSFWIPRLAGKKDAINNRVNRIWFTPADSAAGQVFNGFCAEYCGDSHGNMQFRVFVVTPGDFESWAAHNSAPAVFGVTTALADSAATAPTAPAVYEFPRQNIADYAIPKTPYPKGVEFDDTLVGDATRGMAAYNNTCIACHAIGGTPFLAAVGPNLTHVGSRTTIASALYPATVGYLSRWVKNAPAMKPGSKMPAQGQGITDPLTGATGIFTDQQIADIVAYLMALK